MEGLKRRDYSIDLFRGLTLALMLIVNNPGSWGAMFSQLRHAKWHGYTLTDTVFPFFLFAVGLAIGIKCKSLNRKNLLPRPSGIWWRFAAIFSLGILLNAVPLFIPKPGEFTWQAYIDGFDKLRLLGVLQRIAICYLVWAWLLRKPNLNFTWKFVLKWLVIFAAIYEFFMLLPLPSQGYEILVNNARAFDTWILGRDWMYSRSAIEPEGLISTLGALVTCGSGVLAYWILDAIKDDSTSRLEQTNLMIQLSIPIVGFGAVIGELGLEPINKQLWTVSYAVLMSGLSFFTLGFCGYAAELYEKTNEAKVFHQLVSLYRKFINAMMALGKNALVIYIASSFFGRILISIKWNHGTEGKLISLKHYIYSKMFLPIAPNLPKVTSFLYALVFLSLFTLLAVYLDRKGHYFRA